LEVVSQAAFFVMSAYQTHIQSKRWQSLSKLCRLAARNKCQMCGTTDAVMHSHHMSYERMAKDDEAVDLCVLCEPCHVLYHRKHKFPPAVNASRSKRLDDLSTVLATYGVDVSYFHSNRAMIDGGWMRSLAVSKEPVKVQEEKPRENPMRYEIVTPEIIELAKLKSNIVAFMNVFKLKAPLREGWEKTVLGKKIKKKTVNRFRRNKNSEWQKARNESNKKARLAQLAKTIVSDRQLAELSKTRFT